jgi:hypothetical protein
MTRVAIWKAIIMGRDGPSDSWGKVLNGQIFIAGYLQFLEGERERETDRQRERDRQRQRERAPAPGTVFNWMFQRWPGDSGIFPRVVSKHTLENGFVCSRPEAPDEMGEMCTSRK